MGSEMCIRDRRVQAANYIERVVPLTLTENQTLAVDLDPLFQPVTTIKTNEKIVGDANCVDWWSFSPESWGSDNGPCQLTYFIDVHHRGALTAEVAWRDALTAPHMAVYRVSATLPFAPLPSEHGFNYVGGRISVELFPHQRYFLRLTHRGCSSDTLASLLPSRLRRSGSRPCSSKFSAAAL